MIRERSDGATGGVLVTGSAGYIGGALLQKLLVEGVPCVGADKAPSKVPADLCFDLTDPTATRSVLERTAPRVIVHCATHSAGAHNARWVASFREDTNALANMLDCLATAPATRLIYISSSYVYSGLNLESVEEETPLRPAHNFGVSKAFFEQFLLRVHPNSVVFRLSSVFGAGNHLNPNAVSDMAKESRERGEITVWGRGTRRMQFVYLDDVLAHLVRAFDLPPGTYNLGGDQYVTVAEAAEMVAKRLGSSVKFLTDKKEGMTLPFMRNDKLTGASGMRFRPLEETLSLYLTASGGTSR